MNDDEIMICMICRKEIIDEDSSENWDCDCPRCFITHDICKECYDKVMSR